MTKNSLPKYASYGFTLTELAVSLVIIAALVGMSISATVPILQQAKVNATAKKMATIEQALLKFSAANGRIPCPTDLTLTQGSANYGQEAGYAVGGVGTGECQHNLTPAANFATATTGGTAEGGVPTAALSLPNDFMYDGWGNKFRYVVDPTYTLSAQHSAWPIPSYIGCVSSSTSITVNDESGVARTTKAIYAIISHGPNGHGAYTSNGITINAGVQATDEQTNCHCDTTGSHTGGATTLSSATYVQKDPQYQSGKANQPLYYFDDIVTYKENWQMQTASNQAPSSCPYLYVADYSNNRVLALSTNGAFFMGFGSSYNGETHGVGTPGSSDQQLHNPSSVAIDSSGNVWVADTSNNRIVKYNSSGQWRMTIGGLTTDACGGVYDAAASPTFCDPLPASTDGGVSRAAGTTCCGTNATTCSCTKTNVKGGFNISDFGAPQQIAFDSAGNLWATDYNNGRVQEFNSTTGAFMGSFTSSLSCPSGLAIDQTNNTLWVFDDCNDQPYKCTTAGSCSGAGGPVFGGNWASDYVTVDPSSRNVWVNDGSKAYKWNSSGTYQSSLSTIHTTNSGGLFFDSSGNLWVADDSGNNVNEVNPANGNLIKTIGTGASGTGTNPAQFNTPQCIWFTNR